AVQLRRVARAPRDLLPRSTCSRHKLGIAQTGRVARGERETANENREPEIRRLSKLSIKQRKKSGGVEQNGKKSAGLELAHAEKADAESQHRSPNQISGPKKLSAVQNNASPFAFS